MIRIEFQCPKEKTASIGERFCKALVGNKAYIENDIVVNYDTPGKVILYLGDENEDDIFIIIKAMEMVRRQHSEREKT